MTKDNILIVDDLPANLQFLNSILVERGYQVRPAINGQVALKIAQKTLPDLILLDIQMPGINGYEVCKRLKDNDKTCDIPVIFISALSEVFDKVKAFSVGGVDYMTKPFQSADFGELPPLTVHGWGTQREGFPQIRYNQYDFIF